MSQNRRKHNITIGRKKYDSLVIPNERVVNFQKVQQSPLKQKNNRVSHVDKSPLTRLIPSTSNVRYEIVSMRQSSPIAISSNPTLRPSPFQSRSLPPIRSV